MTAIQERPDETRVETPADHAVAAPDPKALQAVLDGPHAEVRAQTLAALCALDLPEGDGLPRDAYRDKVLDWARSLAHEGTGARSFPVEYGGQDDPAGRVAGFQELAHGDLSLAIKVGVQFGLFGGSIHRLGTKRHHDAYLRDTGTLDLPGCFAMSESGHGSDVRGIRTQARYDAEAGEFVLHTPDETARKDWIGSAAMHARLAVVFAQLDVDGKQQGVHAFVVPIRNEDGSDREGVEIEDCGDKMGLNGVDNGRIRFYAVRIPRADLLDRYGTVDADGTYDSPIHSPGARFFTMIGALVEGRISIAGSALSVARNGLTTAVRWGERRRQFGTGIEQDVPLMDYLTHQRRLLPPIAESYALQAAWDVLLEQYAETLDGTGDTRDVEKQAAGLKALCTWHMTGALQQARECCGGKGYLSENRFAAWRDDSDVFVTFEGDNTVLMQLVAKALLSEHAGQFEELDVLGMARHATTRTVSRLLGETGPLGRLTRDKVELRDPTWQAEALAFREERMVDALARRLKKLMEDEGFGSQQALSYVLDHVLGAANAHLRRLVHERFTGCVDAHPELPVLAHLRDLATLSELEADRAWFLEHGYLNADDSQALVTEVNELCRELRPHALALVEGFGVPDALLRAPIGLLEVPQHAPAGTD